MQLLSVENLSLAAEATVVLLLIAFAWPQKTVLAPVVEASDRKTMSWEPAKFYFLRVCVLRGLYLKHFWASKRNSSDPIDPYNLPEFENDGDKPSIPTPWQDRLTHLLNRQGFDALLKEWMAIDSHHRGDSCISMVTVSTYSDLVTTHGAMVTEQAIQRIASQLVNSLSAKAIIAKYLPDRFVVLHFASQLADCQHSLEPVQQCISEAGFLQVAGESLSLSCSMSIVAIDNECTLNTKIDELDEGIIEAQQSGRNILSRVGESWTKSPPASAMFECPSKSSGSDLASEVDIERPDETADATVSQTNKTEQPLHQKSGTTGSSIFESNGPPSASTDISAVASPDDIATLLAQIDSNKVSKSLEKPNQLEQNPASDVAASETAPVKVEAPTIAMDESEAASVDDTASIKK